MSTDVWDPFLPNRSLRQMLDTVDRLFDNSFPTLYSPSQSSTLRTPWDVLETDNAYKLRFDMPGLSKEEVKTSFFCSLYSKCFLINFQLVDYIYNTLLNTTPNLAFHHLYTSIEIE